jgi:hypothetical protein
MLKDWLGNKAKHADSIVHRDLVIYDLTDAICVVLHALLFVACYSVVPIYQVSAIIINTINISNYELFNF